MNMRHLFILLALGLAGCTQAEQQAQPPLAGARIGGPFALINQDGRRVTDRDFAGRWRIMYFGYTFCPDVCPTGLQNLAAGLRAFEKVEPARGAKVTPIFVTVDPARDTPAVMKSYVAAFHPRMVGLTGDAAAIKTLSKAYGVYAERGAAQGAGGYLVDHSAQAYLMDPDGKPIALLSSEGPPTKVADELTQWVK